MAEAVARRIPRTFCCGIFPSPAAFRRRKVINKPHISAAAGVARYNVATPTYSVYFGVGGLWRDIFPKWDLGLDLRNAQNVARDHVLAADPQGPRPETFYKIETALLYLSRRF